MWSYNSNSYFSSCNNSAVGLITTIQDFIDFTKVKFPTAFKDESFALVSTLEYPYPISVFCYSAIFEVYYDMGDRFTIFSKQPVKLLENLLVHIGTISLNLMTAPDCLPDFDGVCFGQRLGIAINYLLYP
jgi:hypothetical protein